MGLDGVYKLVNDYFIRGKDSELLAERLYNLMARCQEAEITLTRNKVQVGEKVSFIWEHWEHSIQKFNTIHE